MSGSGTAEDPWVLKTPPGTSEFTMHRDDTADPAELVGRSAPPGCATSLAARRCARQLRAHGDWMEPADENKRAKEGTLEAWARSPDNPVGGWSGLRNGY